MSSGATIEYGARVNFDTAEAKRAADSFGDAQLKMGDDGEKAQLKLIKITQRTERQLKRLERQLDPTAAANGRLASNQRLLKQALEQGLISQARYNDLLERAEQKTRAQDRATKQLERRYERLERQLDPASARTRELAAAERLLSQMRSRGVISQAKYNDLLARARAQLRGASGAASRLTAKQVRLNAAVSRGAVVVKGLVAAYGVLLGLGLVGQVLRIGGSFEQLEAILERLEGEKTPDIFLALQVFAAKTPFQVDQVIAAYTKLGDAGIKPTQERMTAFGDIAASKGKSILDFSEAVVAATTGEMERLKAFGIVAKLQGDQVIFNFKGQRTAVARDSTAIVGYLEQLGKTEFAGSMADQAQTFQGALSNVQDAWSQLMATLFDSGVGDAATSVLRTVAEVLGVLRLGVIEARVIWLEWMADLADSPTVLGFVAGTVTALFDALALFSLVPGSPLAPFRAEIQAASKAVAESIQGLADKSTEYAAAAASARRESTAVAKALGDGKPNWDSGIEDAQAQTQANQKAADAFEKLADSIRTSIEETKLAITESEERTKVVGEGVEAERRLEGALLASRRMKQLDAAASKDLKIVVEALAFQEAHYKQLLDRRIEAQKQAEKRAELVAESLERLRTAQERQALAARGGAESLERYDSLESTRQGLLEAGIPLTHHYAIALLAVAAATDEANRQTEKRNALQKFDDELAERQRDAHARLAAVLHGGLAGLAEHNQEAAIRNEIQRLGLDLTEEEIARRVEAIKKIENTIRQTEEEERRLIHARDAWESFGHAAADAIGQVDAEYGDFVRRAVDLTLQLVDAWRALQDGARGIEGALAGLQLGGAVGSALYSDRNYRGEGAELGGGIGGIWGPVGAAVGTALGAAVGSLFDKATETARGEIELAAGRLRAQVAGASGEAGKILAPFAEALRDQLTGIIDDLGGQLEALKLDLEIRLDKGLGEGEFVLNLNGLERVFDNVDDAVAFAISEAFRRGEISGLSPEAEQLISSYAIDTAEELDLALALAIRLERGRIGAAAFEVKESVRAVFADLQAAIEGGVDLELSFQSAGARLQEIRDELTGTERTAEEIAEQRRQAYNAEVTLLKARILLVLEELRLREQEVRFRETANRRFVDSQSDTIDATQEAANAFAGSLAPAILGTGQAALQGAQAIAAAGGQVGSSMAGAAGAMAGAAGVAVGAAQATTSAAAQASAQLQSLLDSLPDLIAPGEIHIPTFGGGGGSASSGAAQRAQERERFMDDLARAELLLSGAGDGLVQMLEALGSLDERVEAARRAGVAEEQRTRWLEAQEELLRRQLLGGAQSIIANAGRSDAERAAYELFASYEDQFQQAFVLAERMADEIVAITGQGEIMGQTFEEIFEGMKDQLDQAFAIELAGGLLDEVARLAAAGDSQGLRNLRDFVNGLESTDLPPGVKESLEAMQEQWPEIFEAIEQGLTNVAETVADGLSLPLEHTRDQVYATIDAVNALSEALRNGEISHERHAEVIGQLAAVTMANLSERLFGMVDGLELTAEQQEEIFAARRRLERALFDLEIAKAEFEINHYLKLGILSKEAAQDLLLLLGLVQENAQAIFEQRFSAGGDASTGPSPSPPTPRPPATSGPDEREQVMEDVARFVSDLAASDLSSLERDLARLDERWADLQARAREYGISLEAAGEAYQRERARLRLEAYQPVIDALAEIRGTGPDVTERQSFNSLRTDYRQALLAARLNPDDSGAARRAADLALELRALAGQQHGTASGFYEALDSSLESDLAGLLARAGVVTGTPLERTAELAGRQVDLLTEIRDALAGGYTPNPGADTSAITTAADPVGDRLSAEAERQRRAFIDSVSPRFAFVPFDRLGDLTSRPVPTAPAPPSQDVARQVDRMVRGQAQYLEAMARMERDRDRRAADARDEQRKFFRRLDQADRLKGMGR